MSNSHRIVVLLTACVNPNGMSKTVLQDVELRRKQYVNALNFYCKKHHYQSVSLRIQGLI